MAESEKKKGLVLQTFPRWLVALFAAFMLSVSGAAIVPAAQNLTAPFVCPNGYAASGVVVQVSHPGAGKTRMTSDFYCIDGSGTPLRTTQLVVVLVLFLLYVPPSWLVLWLVTGGLNAKDETPWEGL